MVLFDFFSYFFFISAVVLGVQGRATQYGPAEEVLGFNEIEALARDETEFELLDHKWKMIFERNGEFLGITLEGNLMEEKSFNETQNVLTMTNNKI